MAKPRIFVSSTFYDLKYVRASLQAFIRSLGYEPILSETGNIAYTPDAPLDESCYREAQNCDIYVLIIGGRYGTEASKNSTLKAKVFFDRYESITKREYESVVNRGIPIYILIDKAVYVEYQTFKRNQDNEGIDYAQVDSVNVFHLIDEVMLQPKNNPVHAFASQSEIEEWLKEQWAGLFREFIKNFSEHRQLSSFSSQITEFTENNKAFKHHLDVTLPPTSSHSKVE